MACICLGVRVKFYNRKNEVGLIKRILNAEGTRFVIVKGIRRIGKTRIILEMLKQKNYAYIFIPKDKTTGSFLEETSNELNIPKFTKITDFLRYVFDKYEFVFMDEFQNFTYLDKSTYSDMQKLLDEFKRDGKKICIFVAGSSYSLMNKIFSDYSKALYGRRDIEITLGELDIIDIFKLLDDLGIKDFQDKIKFWSVFGGIPKFYELVEILSPNSFEEFIEITFSTNFRSWLDEGNTILKSEFGGEYKTYYTVMEAIAYGKTKLSEISSVFGNNATQTNRYLTMLRKEYNLVMRADPLISRKSRLGTYATKNNFFNFWFRFVKKHESYHEQKRTKEIVEFFKENFNSYLGAAFELLCKELLKENIIMPSCAFTKTGRQWGHIKEKPKGQNAYEIDIVALNEKTKEILFCECKWKNKVNAEKVLAELKEKAQHVQWNNQKRKEHYAVFAKSFSKKVKEENVHCFDLKDLEKAFKK